MNTDVQKISVDKIIPNRFQPRKNFDEESLQELANSIRQHGIIQPLVLRKLGESYEIIAGERRYKAAMKIGLKEVPAIVMELDDTSSAEIALIENIQRKDLTAIEEAKSYEKILELGNLNQEELAKRIGRNQSTVSNKLRLLNLSEEAQKALLDNKISERHARSLLRIKDIAMQTKMLNNIIENRLTVRETDKEIKNILGENGMESNDSEEIIDIIDDIPNLDEIKNRNINILESNNPVYINPEIIPPEDNSQTVIEVGPQLINNQFQQPNLSEFDQIGTNNIEVPEISLFNSPIIEPNPIVNEKTTSGRFFNLDDEIPNMDMGDINSSNSNNYINPNQFIPYGIPNFDENDVQPQNSYNEPIDNKSNILDSNPTAQQPIIQRQDITGAVAVIRNTIMNLQNNGYLININEENTESHHQITIEIKK